MRRLETSHFPAIPEEILDYASRISEWGIREGYSGMTGCEPWSIRGIGPVDHFQDRLKNLEEALLATDNKRMTLQLQLEELWNAISTDKSDRELKTIVTKQKQNNLPPELHEPDS